MPLKQNEKLEIPIFDPKQLSGDLGIYIHVPFCKHECPYCDFYKFSIKNKPSRQRVNFLEMVFSELEIWVKQAPELLDQKIATIYFGGGTPGLLPAAKITDFLNRIQSEISFAENPEITLEANPENCTESNLNQWYEAGVNRLSLGVQTFQASQLEFLERLHTPEVLEGALERISSSPINNYSLDLMFGLPNQSMSDFKDDVGKALRWNPNHISLYGLTYHEGTPLFEDLKNKKIKSASEPVEADMFKYAHDSLTENGFDHYEVSNYGKPEFRSQHNQRYWGLKDVLGLGPGAASSLGNHRFQNRESIDHWEENLKLAKLSAENLETISDKDRSRERLLTQLRKSSGIIFNEYREYVASLNKWSKSPVGIKCREEGWVLMDDECLKLSIEGWLRSNSILESINSNLDYEPIR